MRDVCCKLVGIAGMLMVAVVEPATAESTPVQSLQEQRQHGVILQQWELSCAAAALATVLRYQHGVPATERSVALGMINRSEYLANPALVSLRQGFSLLDMKRYTYRLGYTGQGLGQMSYDDLLQRAPVIVPINTHGYPHFVVFRGALLSSKSSSVLLADPAFGNITLSKSHFLESWIQYRDLGHVGFVVVNHVNQVDGVSPPGRLRARLSEFPLVF